MARTIAVMWIGLSIVLCLDMLITPYRWMWTVAAGVGVTFIFGYLFNVAEEFERQQYQQQRKGKNRSK